MKRQRLQLAQRLQQLAERLGPGGWRTLYGFGLLSAARAAALVVFAGALADGISAVVNHGSAWHGPSIFMSVVLGLAAAAGRALLTWLSAVVAARSASTAKETLRAELAAAFMKPGAAKPGQTGSNTSLASVQLDGLDEYYGTVLPAVTNAAIIPILIGVRILSADWVSALIVILTVPLIPVFMVLIGLHTRDAVADSARALGRLSDHLVELARGLPVLVGLGRVAEQTAALRAISDRYRATTMATLRTAFLSSLVLELIATISVAVVAVFVGLRLVTGSLPLEVGLLALILVPECFAPFRDLGAAFHSARNGQEALAQARAVIDSAEPLGAAGTATVVADTATVVANTVTSARAITVSDLTVSYSGRSVAALAHLSFTVLPLTVTSLSGVSGAGKSTALAFLAGRMVSGAEVAVSGRCSGVVSGRVAWVPQHPVAAHSTVAAELQAYGEGLARPFLEARITELCQLLGLTHLLSSDPAQLSPGELRRLAFARALLRVDAGAHLLLLDEPTAHLDPISALAVRAEIEKLRGRVTIVLASHDPQVVALADTAIALDGRRAGPDVSPGVVARSPGVVAAPAPFGGEGSAAETGRATQSDRAAVSDRAPQSDRAPRPGRAPQPAARNSFVALTRFLADSPLRFAAALGLSLAATLFAVALTAVSGWLIVRASEQVAIMYLMVAIVGVRFFGIGRSVLNYGARLFAHDAVFSASNAARLRLWGEIARRGPASRTLLAAAHTLDQLVVVVDRVRDAVPRVVLPFAVGVLAGAAAVIAVWILAPSLAPILLASVLVCLLGGPALAIVAERRAGLALARLRSDYARRCARLVGAAADLAVNGVDGPYRATLAECDRAASRASRRVASAGGAASAFVVLVCGVAAVAMIAAAAASAAASSAAVSSAAAAASNVAGSVAAPLVAVVVLIPVALIEPLQGVAAATRLWPVLAVSLRSFGAAAPRRPVFKKLPAAPPTLDALNSRPIAVDSHPVRELTLQNVAARWPGAKHPVFTGVTAVVRPGEWLVVQGPSGAGKSTLIALLLGYLAPETGSYRLNGRPVDASSSASASSPASASNSASAVSPASASSSASDVSSAELRSRVAWAPQEGHIFNSTLRANLILGRPRDDRPADDELWAVLDRVGLGTLARSLAGQLDTPIGSQGARLSGGERQRLVVARALLSRASILLLDEPTAHLDAAGARSLISDLRRASADRIVVLVTHRADDITPCDTLLRLGDLAQSALEPAQLN